MEQYLVHISPDIFAVIMLAFILHLLRSDRMIGKRQAKELSFVAILIVLIILFEAYTIYLEEYPVLNGLRNYKISKALVFSLSPMIGIAMAVIYYHNLRRYLILIMIPICIFITISILSIWYGWTFNVDAIGHYERGPLFLISILTNLYSLAIYSYALSKKGKSFDEEEQTNLQGQFYIILLGTLIQLRFPKILMIWPSCALALMFYYNFLKDISYKYDSLTQTKNRRCFDERLKEVRESENMFIVVFDINKLKFVNDRYGHAKGDEYIKVIANILKEVTINMGALYRIGGDEFCFLSDNIPEIIMRKKLDEVDKEIRKLNLYKNDTQFTTNYLAYGYARYSKSKGITIEECFKLADRAMYEKKSKQKETV